MNIHLSKKRSNSKQHPYTRLDEGTLRALMEQNERGLLMTSLIDTIKCEVFVSHVEAKTLAVSPNCKKRSKGGWLVASKVPDGSSAIVKSLDGGARIFIEASAIKFLTGQNIWGGEQVAELATLFCFAVLEQAGIIPSNAEREAIFSGDVRLLRLDLTVHCGCESPVIASWLMRALFFRANLSAKDLSRVAGYETIYLGQHSKWKTLKIYRKDLELKGFPPSPSAFRGTKIRQLEIGIIRFELVLRRQYLADHGLDRPAAWSSELFRTLLAKELYGLVAIAGVAAVRDQFKSLSPQLQLKVRLWAAGDEGELSTPSMFERDRRMIEKATGFDIATPATIEEQGRILRSLRDELLAGLSFRCHWCDWTDHEVGLMSFINKRHSFPGRAVPSPSAAEWVGD
jgi:hypothetical protein